MIFRIFFIILATAAITAVNSAAEAGHEDGNSIASLAINMNEKFQQLFDIFAQLEVKVDRILERQNGLTSLLPEEEDERTRSRGHVGSSNGSNGHQGSMKAQLNESLTQVNRLQSILSQREYEFCIFCNDLRLLKLLCTLVVVVPTCQKAPARVSRPVIVTEVNAAQNLSCHSPGHSVGSCLWGHRVNGRNQVIVNDDQTVENPEWKTSVEGVSFTSGQEDLDSGNCTLQISNVTQDHFGLWSCTLITKNSTVLRGAVQLGKS